MPSQNTIRPQSRTRGITTATTTLGNRGGMWSRVYQRVLLAKHGGRQEAVATLATVRRGRVYIYTSAMFAAAN